MQKIHTRIKYAFIQRSQSVGGREDKGKIGYCVVLGFSFRLFITRKEKKR